MAAVGAAGTGPIAFLGHATLKIDNAALSGHVFVNEIALLAQGDALDLSGLKFHPGAKAKYHPATETLTVHSGHVTDTLTLLSPHGTHFIAANDGHGGTKVTLDPPPVTATMASLSTDGITGHDWVTQVNGANHAEGFLLVG